MLNKNMLIVITVLSLVLLGVAVYAQTAGYEFSSASFQYDYTGSYYTFGYAFTVSADTTVTALGVYDQASDGLGASHEVSIWDNDNPATPIISATVAAGAINALIGHFRYINCTPTTLVPGKTYVIGTSAEGDMTAVNQTSPVWGTGISFVEIRYGVGTSAGTIYPDTVAPASWASPVYVGAGFLTGGTGVSTGTLSGHVDLQDYFTIKGLPIAALIVLSQGGATIRYETQMLTGTDYILTNVPSGTYDMKLSVSGFLEGNLSGVVVSNGGVTTANISLQNGDVDGDGTVTTTDLSVVIKNMP